MALQDKPDSGLKSLPSKGTPAPGVACRGCDERLPVRLAQHGETPALWECSACSTQLPGMLITDCASIILTRIRLADLHFDVDQVPAIPEVLLRLVQMLAEQPTPSDILERRQSARVPQQLNVTYTLLDESYAPLGGAFRAVVHNISEHGVGFLSTQSVDSPKVAIELGNRGNRRLQAFGRVARVREIGGQFYEVGVELELRLGRWFF